MPFQSRPTRPVAPLPGNSPWNQQPFAPPVAQPAAEPGPSLRRLPGINTKLAGTTFAAVGQRALAMIQQAGQAEFEQQFCLSMKTDWENPYDADAVAVYLKNTSTNTEVKLGFLPNKERVCVMCGHSHAATTAAADQVVTCTQCGSAVARDGVASIVSKRVREAQKPIEEVYDITIAWDAGGVTGTPTTHKGCNVRLSPHDQAPVR